jgi:hypothetical protein
MLPLVEAVPYPLIIEIDPPVAPVSIVVFY